MNSLPKELASSKNPFSTSSILDFLVICFIASCIFDPADRILGLKIPLFVCFLLIASSALIFRKSNPKVHLIPIFVSLFFLFIPLLGLLNGIAYSGENGELGFQMMKGYILIILLPLLCALRMDIIPKLVYQLLLLSILIIATYLVVNLFPETYIAISELGNISGLVLPDRRSYGNSEEFLQVYYVTSPMIVIAVAYFFSLAMEKKNIRYYLAFAISVIAMLMAGTRNNIFVAFILPLALIFFRSKYKILFFPLFVSFIFLSILIFWEEVIQFLSPDEFSNSVKITLVKDYFQILSEPYALIFGQGLGVNTFWSAKGYELHLSELTYFEMIRNFGLLGFVTMIYILLLPLIVLFTNDNSGDFYKNLVIAYIFYLIMCFTNPNLFSSMGILIFISVFSNYFICYEHIKG